MTNTNLSLLAGLLSTHAGCELISSSPTEFVSQAGKDPFHQGIAKAKGRLVSDAVLLDLLMLCTHSRTMCSLKSFASHLAILEAERFSVLTKKVDGTDMTEIWLRFQIDRRQLDYVHRLESWLQDTVSCAIALQNDIPVYSETDLEQKYRAANLSYVYPCFGERISEFIATNLKWFEEVTRVIKGDYPVCILCEGMLHQRMVWHSLATYLVRERRSVGLLNAGSTQTKWSLVDILGVWERNLGVAADALIRLNEVSLRHEFPMVYVGTCPEMPVYNAVVRDFPRSVELQHLVELALDSYGRENGGVALRDRDQLHRNIVASLERFGPVNDEVLAALVKSNLRSLPSIRDPAKNLEFLFSIS
ncbi:MAG: hypothetical protein OEM26_05390 [Saprospiraceae bacterium]|nr:hypothetical protein [Saprospiraceae bacterium]